MCHRFRRRRAPATTFVVCIILASAARGDTLCVKPGGGDGCHADFAAALAAASDGDLIRVAAGTYVENVEIEAAVVLEGGWNQSFSERDVDLHETVIRPSDATRSVVAVRAPTSGNGEGAVLDGLTITGGRGDLGYNHGGGLKLIDSNATVRRSTIAGNVAFLFGGGVWVQRGSPTFIDNEIRDNIVWSDGDDGRGGGVELENVGGAVLERNLIVYNAITAGSSGTAGGGNHAGGGVAILGGEATMRDNTFLSNSASVDLQVDGIGGGLSAENASLTLERNRFIGNEAYTGDGSVSCSAFGFGSALHFRGGTDDTVVLQSNLFDSNGTTSETCTLGATVAESSLAESTPRLSISDNTYLRNGSWALSLGNSTGEIRHDSITEADLGLRIDSPAPGSNISIHGITVDVETTAIELLLVSDVELASSILRTNQGSAINIPETGGFATNLRSVTNCTFLGKSGSALRNRNAAAVHTQIRNNIVVGYDAAFNYADATPEYEESYNVYWDTAPPDSLHPTSRILDPQLQGDFTLPPDSPLIDAGTIDAPFGLTDFQGEPRLARGPSGLFRVDIGADESPGAHPILRDLSQRPADFTLIGPGNPVDNPGSEGSNDHIGYAVLLADVNGDRRDDLIVGAPNHSDDFSHEVNDSGRVYGLLGDGSRPSGVRDLLDDAPDLEVRSWIHLQHVGRWFAAADVDDDGTDDLIIGSTGDALAGPPDPPGEVFVFSGGTDLAGVRTLAPVMDADYRVRGENALAFSERYALTAAQLDGMGGADLAIADAFAQGPGLRSEAGAVHVVFGSGSLPGFKDLGADTADLTVYGPATGARLGRVTHGDVTDDGLDDLILRGDESLWILPGPLAPATIDLLLPPPGTITIDGLIDGVLAAGDFDGDGADDVAVAGAGNDEVLLFSGAHLTTNHSPSDAVLRIGGVLPHSLLFFDWNRDGRDDLVIGDITREMVAVVFGDPELSGGVHLLEAAGWIIGGEAAGDRLGVSLAAGDLDSDGDPDLVIGSRLRDEPSHDPFFEDAGAVYVLYGPRSIGQPPLFTDGFESGDLSRWATATP